jgi:hypothetical protein
VCVIVCVCNRVCVCVYVCVCKCNSAQAIEKCTTRQPLAHQARITKCAENTLKGNAAWLFEIKFVLTAFVCVDLACVLARAWLCVYGCVYSCVVLVCVCVFVCAYSYSFLDCLRFGWILECA